jgi:hypothetical protein
MFYRYPEDHIAEDGVIAAIRLVWIHLADAFDAYICFDEFVDSSEDVLMTGHVV